jgi:hypothetical protein
LLEFLVCADFLTYTSITALQQGHLMKNHFGNTMIFYAC